MSLDSRLSCLESHFADDEPTATVLVLDDRKGMVQVVQPDGSITLEPLAKHWRPGCKIMAGFDLRKALGITKESTIKRESE